MRRLLNDPGASPIALFAAEHHRYRKQTGLSQADLARTLYYSAGFIGYIEAGARTPSEDYADRADRVLGAGGGLRNCWQLLARTTTPKCFRPYTELEGRAVDLRVWEWSAVPDLLQTEDYATALARADQPDAPSNLTAAEAAARMHRQQILQQPAPPTLWAVIDEYALTRPAGSQSIMRAQFAHLLELAELPHVTVQVLPFTVGAHPGRIGAFTILDLGDGWTDVVRTGGPHDGPHVDMIDDVADCARRFDHLRAMALSPAASQVLITRLAT